VHRWTAESLKKRWEETARREYHRRAGETLVWRALNITHSVLDIMGAVRHFLEAQAFDQAVAEAWEVVRFLRTYGRMADLAAFCAEVRAGLPVEDVDYPGFCAVEGDALFPLGDLQGALGRYGEARSLYKARVEVEPDRTDFQTDPLSLVRMAQVDPTAAPRHLSRALDILRTLRGERRLSPDKSQWLEALEKMLGTR